MVKAELEFRTNLARDTYVKENGQDRERFKKYFDDFVRNYFQDDENIRTDFNKEKHCLDCYIPAYGRFKCNGKDTGTKKTTRESRKAKKNHSNRPCGKDWTSNIAWVRFSCTFDKNDDGDDVLTIKPREYGQRCKLCQRHYELPSFNDRALEKIMWLLRKFINEGIFDVLDENIEQENSHSGYNGSGTTWRRRPDGRYFDGYNRRRRPPHLSYGCEACQKNLNCGDKNYERRKRYH